MLADVGCGDAMPGNPVRKLSFKAAADFPF